ncbi:putative translation initiation inhibitor [Chytriomyces sp. MP71]|nr:putative translation initiation inhibitor [Chytriomyces sp. MP71]
MSAIQRIGVTRRYADAVVFNGTAHIVEVADDASQPFAAQVEQCLRQMDERLALVNSDRGRLVQVLIFVKRLEDVPALNDRWDNWVPHGSAPVRACVQANMVSSDCLIEFVVTAAVKQ